MVTLGKISHMNVNFIAEITSTAKTEIIRNISKLYDICIEYINGESIKERLRPNERKIIPSNIPYHLYLIE